MTDLVLDAAKSEVTIRTFAEGLLARLAHDLELACGALEGTASRTERSVAIEAPLRAITVVGAVKREKTDPSALSASDREDILGKMRRDVFHATESAKIRIEATVDQGGAATIRVMPPNGQTARANATVKIEEGDFVRASGSFEISLAAIGSGVVKAPMGAFRVKDRVTVRFDLVFREPNQPA